MDNRDEPNNESVFPPGQVEKRICHNPRCEYSTFEPLAKCPKCGRPIWTTVQFRLISSVLVLCGLFFIVLGAGLVYLFTFGPFQGGEALRLLLLGFSGLILSLGLSVAGAGLWQVIFGRANMKIIKTLLYLMCAFFAFIIFGRLIIRIFE
jgi:hypothetical protein